MRFTWDNRARRHEIIKTCVLNKTVLHASEFKGCSLAERRANEDAWFKLDRQLGSKNKTRRYSETTSYIYWFGRKSGAHPEPPHPFDDPKPAGKCKIAVPEVVELLLQILRHESNYFGNSIIPRFFGKCDAEWKIRVNNEPEFEAYKRLLRFIDGLKQNGGCDSLLTYLSLPENGGLILDNQTFYNDFLKGCVGNRLIHGNYTLPFLEASGIHVLDKNKMYPSEESLREMMLVVANDPNNAHIFSGLDDRIEKMREAFLWMTSSWDRILVVLELWENYNSYPLYVQEKLERYRNGEKCACDKCTKNDESCTLWEKMKKHPMFAELDHLREDRKKEFVDKYFHAIQPVCYNRDQFEKHRDIMQMICCESHQVKSISTSRRIDQRVRIHQDTFMYLLLSRHDHKCPITGEDLSDLKDILIDGHHMYFINARDDFGTAWRLAQEKTTREAIRQTVFDSPEEFGKVAIEEALTCIPVTPAVHKILHLMQKDGVYEKLREMGMPADLDFRGGTNERLSLYFAKDSTSNKENDDPIANVAQAISSIAETDRAQDVLSEVVFDNVARATSSTAKPRSKRVSQSKQKKSKKI